MTDDSLRDVIGEFGASDLAVAIEDEYEEQLNPQYGPAGQPIESLREVGRAIRQFDHGQASEQSVSQTGVRASFDPETTDLDDLQPGGEIRQRLMALAEEHLKCDVQEIDLASVTEDRYMVWIVADRDDLL